MRAFAAYLILLFSLIACNYKEVKLQSPEINTLKKGEKFMIRLPDDHSQGYVWQLTEDYNISVIEKRNEAWHGNVKGLYVNFQAKKAGHTTLTFIRRKYNDTIDTRSFIVKIADH